MKTYRIDYECNSREEKQLMQWDAADWGWNRIIDDSGLCVTVFDRHAKHMIDDCHKYGMAYWPLPNTEAWESQRLG